AVLRLANLVALRTTAPSFHPIPLSVWGPEMQKCNEPSRASTEQVQQLGAGALDLRRRAGLMAGDHLAQRRQELLARPRVLAMQERGLDLPALRDGADRQPLMKA